MNLTEIFVNKLKIETSVVSIDSLFNDEGKLKRTLYNPPYQRNYVWDAEKATYFLESIFIGTEIPPLIFFRSGSKREIIDGRQRYETILRFLHNELKLKKSGLKILDVLDLGKKVFSDLPIDLQNDFLDTKIRVIEFSFATSDGITRSDEDSVKQEIFKRYNSGITPLKSIEIDKAIYFEDDLNTFFKERLKEPGFRDLFTTLFKYEDKKEEISLKKIRQLLVLHKIPIKYYSIAKQKVIDKYYDLLSSQIDSDTFTYLFESFNQKLALINIVRELVDNEDHPYNRLISETLFWAFSIMEDNNKDLPKADHIALAGFSSLILNNYDSFQMDRSSFANEIVTRYTNIADYLAKEYDINTNIYINTSKEFIQRNRELSHPKENLTVSFQDLRINKPEPSTNTIDDICRQMKRSRFLVRPPYQREEVINKKKSSEIIESILLGIKLPPIFIFKNRDGISEVIDGQQRILSILAFLGRSYLNESGEMVESKKNGFSLQLKDSILVDLHGKCFRQLDEELQDKITSFGLWIIEINYKNNPSFEPLDLFIRLNNKPYPIKDDTFEMWNSYIDRGLIDTIKGSYANCSSWFFLRKLGNRMENENNYAVLSYFNYLELNHLETNDKGPLDIYKVGPRIAFRLRSKGDISKVLENGECKNSFIEAVNHFEFSFIANLKILLSADEDSSDKTLSKNLDEMLGIENGKRTQQSFYVLWYFLKGLDPKKIVKNRKITRGEVRKLFLAMQMNVTIENFNLLVNSFRSHYLGVSKEENLLVKLGDISVINLIENNVLEDNNKYDFYINRDNRLNRRIKLLLKKPYDVDAYYGCRINREGFTVGFVSAVLMSSHIFNENQYDSRIVSISSIRSIALPLLSMSKQRIFDKIISYTKTSNEVQKMFFESVIDRLVEEVFYPADFKLQNLSLFDEMNKLKDLKFVDKELVEAEINSAYHYIVNGDDGFFSNFSAASGITGSLYNEKN